MVSFTAHIVVCGPVDRAWVRERLPEGELSEAFTPPFLGALATHLGRRVNAIDAVLLAPRVTRPAGLALTPFEHDHPRVRRAQRYRTDVSAWSAPGGVIVLGRGLAGRWEVAVEVEPEARDRGLGRALAATARHLVPDDRPLWAQVAPGNAASVRAFLAAGYAPVGMEALLVVAPGGDT